MTGFRDKVLSDKLTKIGAEQGNTIIKTTFVVVVKTIDVENSKTQKAKLLKIPIMTTEEFIAKFNI